MVDIWEELYLRAKEYYHPTEVNSFIYTNHVVCALESKSGQIFTGYCIEGTGGTINLCAERMALINMYQASGETQVKRIIAFRDTPPTNHGGMPCGICRETLMQFSPKNKETQIMVDYESREIVMLEELLPKWWGDIRG